MSYAPEDRSNGNTLGKDIMKKLIALKLGGLTAALVLSLVTLGVFFSTAAPVAAAGCGAYLHGGTCYISVQYGNPICSGGKMSVWYEEHSETVYTGGKRYSPTVNRTVEYCQVPNSCANTCTL